MDVADNVGITPIPTRLRLTLNSSISRSSVVNSTILRSAGTSATLRVASKNAMSENILILFLSRLL